MLLGLKTQQHKVFTSVACESLAMARGEPTAPGYSLHLGKDQWRKPSIKNEVFNLESLPLLAKPIKEVFYTN
jgi:hypothetical protein